MEGDRRILDLLDALDRLPGPEHLEFPYGYDHERAGFMRSVLLDRLSREFGQPCRGVSRQDASAYFGIHVPAAATDAGVALSVDLSNFGDLALVTAADGGTECALTEAERRIIESALSDLGYVRVPQRLLLRPYDGVSGLAGWYPEVDWDGSPNDPVTWETRFFSYL
ncbi:hypothetical protein [Streptomyces sp. WM6386]|uniref:hypothetical protein n=1 Tax=Streptomyces sp. WM6386 TaxID=1415558 RepID=UPI000AD25A28|nr:hypothetical protein [Streptomyces sp. WM6386]